jgi:hypothetical protein
MPLVGFLAVNGVYATQFQIGGAAGLTSSYINSTIGGITGNANGWAERSYTVALFNGATVTASPGNSTVPSLGTVPTGSANVWTDSNLNYTYNLIEDGLGTSANGNNGYANNFWSSTNGAGTIVVPIDIANADKVGIMLNDIWGFTGNNPTITFNFLTAGAVNVALGDGNGGPLRSATSCTAVTGTGVTCPGTITGGHTVSAGTAITSITNPGGIQTSNSGINVYTSTIWTGTYSSPATTGPYRSATGSSSGNVMLDDMVFDLSAYSHDTLDSISFAMPASSGNNVSRLALSAITVDATPEPSTTVLLAVGLGVLALSLRKFSQA